MDRRAVAIPNFPRDIEYVTGSGLRHSLTHMNTMLALVCPSETLVCRPKADPMQEDSEPACGAANSEGCA